jgi:hypothetical protein
MKGLVPLFSCSTTLAQASKKQSKLPKRNSFFAFPPLGRFALGQVAVF